MLQYSSLKKGNSRLNGTLYLFFCVLVPCSGMALDSLLDENPQPWGLTMAAAVPEGVSVEIVSPTQGETSYIPCHVRVRMRGLATLASSGWTLVLHVNGKEIATHPNADAAPHRNFFDEQGMIVDENFEHITDNGIYWYSFHIEHIIHPGVHTIYATLRSGKAGEARERNFRPHAVHFLAAPAWMSGVKITGANIEDKDRTRMFFLLFDKNCPGIGQTFTFPPYQPGFGREGEEFWTPIRECLGAFAARFPLNLLAQWMMGLVSIRVRVCVYPRSMKTRIRNEMRSFHLIFWSENFLIFIA